ncbi:unnamed protein product [Alternaria alternata]|uniref:methionyl-tRNA formyltransferase n=1 Tax=Alternaria alternata TaxID=5599 RepID=A0A4Q4NGS0_ALTAL|nr:hypothetical protein AA0117_g5597 [Alternaria alternata]
MFCRLRGRVYSLVQTPHCRYSSTTVPARTSEPLRILFCGSDNFSIASLRAVADAKRHVPKLIESIDVVHRPAKPTGRGLKKLREVPIKQVATEELNLPTHVIDTFTGWTPPNPIDVVIAVSFGLLVPPRILNYAQYGGLNVHPSLLPDLRGPAPIEHAILKRRQYTGVSVQTLHPRHFDQGAILAQTPMPGHEISLSRDTPDMARVVEQQLATAGAEMLVDVLKQRKFVPPREDVGWYAHSNGPIDHAPKITKQDRYVDFEKHTAADVIAKWNALGDLWCLLPTGERLILHDVLDPMLPDDDEYVTMKPGLFVDSDLEGFLWFRGACGKMGNVLSSTLEGGKKGQGNAKLLQLFGPPRNPSLGDMPLMRPLHRVI